MQTVIRITKILSCAWFQDEAVNQPVVFQDDTVEQWLVQGDTIKRWIVSRWHGKASPNILF